MLGKGEPVGAVKSEDESGQTQVELGKRYSDESLGLELLCTKAGPGPLAVNGNELTIKDAKPLPSSD